jgi:hypothetical protein
MIGAAIASRGEGRREESNRMVPTLQVRERFCMTMAPGRRKRGFWLEIILISVLLFLLIGSRSQSGSTTAGRDFKNPLHRTLSLDPVLLK